VLIFVRIAGALEPTTPLVSFGRQAWGMENGLPQNTIQSLAQTSDGFLWIGTEVGLVRFDGNSFQLFDRTTTPSLPGNDIRCLLTTQDGALWIGTSEGLAHRTSAAATAFTTVNGLPSNSIRGLREGSRGGVIVSTESGEASIQDGKIGPLQLDELQGPVASHDVALADGTHLLVNKREIEWNQNGRLERWTVGRELPGSRIQVWFADRQGALWIGTNAGLARWYSGRLQILPVTDPLAKASILTLMEDREGDLWAGTEADGLHILRDQRFRMIGAREGLTSDNTTAVVEGAAGKLWVGTNGGGLNAIPRTGLEPSVTSAYSVRDVLLSDVILSLAAAPDGDLWVGTPDGLNRIHGSAVDSFTSADGLPDDFIRSLLLDADGSLWIGTRRGLTHWTNPGSSAQNPTGTMQTFTHANGLGSDLVGAMTRDTHGDLWVATFTGLSRLHLISKPFQASKDVPAAFKITNYTTKNGLSSNVITALEPGDNGRLYIGTQDHGWNIWDGQSFNFRPIANNEMATVSVHAILKDSTRRLWFATSNGIAMCALLANGTCGRMYEFGPADGLRSRETATNSHPSAWRKRDGHLLFATPKGLVEVDPAHFSINAVPPGVVLERFTIDDVPQPLRGADFSVQIPAGHVHFEFDYAGLSFVAPQKVRYRYMLAGFDHNWTEAGTRRTAYYTNIPAGHYTFRVQASNNDGEWNLEGVAIAFELRPHFYQTLWFYALLILAVVAVVVLVQRLRLNRAERTFSAVLGERNRIAREIHDTLAQGYVGISVQLELLAELLRMSKIEAAQKHLDLTRGYVREGLADARQSIWALRSQDSGETTLPVKLRRIVEAEGNHAGNPNLEPRFSIFGAYRPLPPGTEQEILRIAQEAIHNVNKHAEATHLSVQLEYGRNDVNLEVRDDGRGFSINQAPTAGHYGLTGMRERAAAVNGTLELTSQPGAGTTIRLRVAAKPEVHPQPDALEEPDVHPKRSSSDKSTDSRDGC
jgi:signal transduction histidine kinase/ligand-binding sensor domain-containing protein